MAKNTLAVAAAALILGFSMASVPVSAADKTETRDLQGFTGIELKGASTLTLRQGDEYSVVVTGDEDIMDQVTTKVRGGTLLLDVDDDSWFSRSSERVHFEVTMPKIEAIGLMGSGTIKSSKIKSQDLELALMGSGDMLLESVSARDVEVELAGSGDIEINDFTAMTMDTEIMGSGDVEVSGEVAKLGVEVMGSGDFSGDRLAAEYVSAQVMGSGDVRLMSAGKHRFSSMGSGDLEIVGK